LHNKNNQKITKVVISVSKPQKLGEFISNKMIGVR